jgi:hypothetical protein
MIWDSNSSNMEKSNVDEKEHIMGFWTGTMPMLKHLWKKSKTKFGANYGH